MGRKWKFGDLNDSFNHIGLISVKVIRTGVFWLSALGSFHSRTWPQCLGREMLEHPAPALLGRVGEVVELKNTSCNCCLVASFRDQVTAGGWLGASTSLEASLVFNRGSDFSQAGSQFPSLYYWRNIKMYSLPLWILWVIFYDTTYWVFPHYRGNTSS